MEGLYVCSPPPCYYQQRLVLTVGYCQFRRQEIVFIGAGMDEEAISKQLDTALLTPAEIEKYIQNYKHIPDPPHPELQQSEKA